LPVWLRGNLDEAVTDPQTDKQGKQRSPRDPSTYPDRLLDYSQQPSDASSPHADVVAVPGRLHQGHDDIKYK